jgi:hypothetical protein
MVTSATTSLASTSLTTARSNGCSVPLASAGRSSEYTTTSCPWSRKVIVRTSLSSRGWTRTMMRGAEAFVLTSGVNLVAGGCAIP